jgi:Fe-S-cluster containining protein
MNTEKPDVPNETPVDNPNDGQVREDLNAALRFVHVMGMQTKRDLVDLTSRLYALTEELVGSGQLNLRQMEERRLRLTRSEEQRLLERAHVQVSDVKDKYALTDLPRIDCESRIHLCKAKCCSLNFPLSFQDLDEGRVKWEYSRPYMILKKSDGYCIHHDASTGCCGVYENRPGVCRTYDCRNDKRIWKDFEFRIPAAEDESAAPKAE